MNVMKLFRYIVRALLSVIVIPIAAIVFSVMTLIRVLISAITAIIVMVFIGSWMIPFSTYLWSIEGDPQSIIRLFDFIKYIADLGEVNIFSGIPDMWKNNFYYGIIKGY